jgi:hypothetical protein
MVMVPRLALVLFGFFVPTPVPVRVAALAVACVMTPVAAIVGNRTGRCEPAASGLEDRHVSGRSHLRKQATVCRCIAAPAVSQTAPCARETRHRKSPGTGSDLHVSWWQVLGSNQCRLRRRFCRSRRSRRDLRRRPATGEIGHELGTINRYRQPGSTAIASLLFSLDHRHTGPKTQNAPASGRGSHPLGVFVPCVGQPFSGCMIGP